MGRPGNYNDWSIPRRLESLGLTRNHINSAFLFILQTKAASHETARTDDDFVPSYVQICDRFRE